MKILIIDLLHGVPLSNLGKNESREYRSPQTPSVLESSPYKENKQCQLDVRCTSNHDLQSKTPGLSTYCSLTLECFPSLAKLSLISLRLVQMSPLGRILLPNALTVLISQIWLYHDLSFTGLLSNSNHAQNPLKQRQHLLCVFSGLTHYWLSERKKKKKTHFEWLHVCWQKGSSTRRSWSCYHTWSHLVLNRWH